MTQSTTYENRAASAAGVGIPFAAVVIAMLPAVLEALKRPDKP